MTFDSKKDAKKYALTLSNSHKEFYSIRVGKWMVGLFDDVDTKEV